MYRVYAHEVPDQGMSTVHEILDVPSEGMAQVLTMAAENLLACAAPGRSFAILTEVHES
jgi:hypothetical protein